MLQLFVLRVGIILYKPSTMLSVNILWSFPSQAEIVVAYLIVNNIMHRLKWCHLYTYLRAKKLFLREAIYI